MVLSREKRQNSYLLCLSIFISGHLSAFDYSASLEGSQWINEGSQLQCQLYQPIPAFGRAIFTKKMNENLRFHLDSYEIPVAESTIELIAEAPKWKRGEGAISLGVLQAEQTAAPIRLASPQSDQLLATLQSGRSPLFSNWQWRQGEDPIAVRVSVVNFMPAYRQYQRCTAGLLDLDFDELKTTTIMFDTDQDDLSPANRARLDTIAMLLNADSTVRHCYVDGYTDDVGASRYNIDLSRRRAESVAAYFQEKGVKSSRITTRFHGEANWVANVPYYHDSARAKNRRVTVRLER